MNIQNVYANSQYKYSEGAKTFTFTESGVFIVIGEEVNSEASTYAETAEISTTATILSQNYYYSNYDAGTNDKRNMALRVAIVQAAANDTITFTNSQTRNYQTQISAVFKLTDVSPREISRIYFRSSTDNTGISTNDTLSLSVPSAGVFFGFIQECRKETSSSTTIETTSSVENVTISPVVFNNNYNSMSVILFETEAAETVSIHSTNSGGSSYASKIYAFYYIGIAETVPQYTVKYNANGGSGSMADQPIAVDEYDYLTPCSFTKTGYVFAGWALSASGAVVYLDGAQVYNLAGADETVNLYAVWERPSLKCKLQYNKSENNKAVKDIEDLREFDFKLKEQTSIIDPVLLITGDITDMLQANYMTIPVFGRSYFITNITSIRTGLVEITAHVDVLSSYIEYIRECTAIVHRQENKWNLYLDDGFFKTYQNPNIVVKKFPSGFTNQSFVLAVAGN